MKNPSDNAGDAGSIPGSGSSPETATHSSILAWEIPGAEEAGGLQSISLCAELDVTEHTHPAPSYTPATHSPL